MDKIILTAGTASAPTELAAFDAALREAGVADANLLHLSSVIPLGCKVVEEPFDMNDTFQGDRLYVVYADMRVSERGMTAAAGLGWVQTTSDPSWGLFVEHVGHTEAEVQRQIELTLNSMMSYRTDHEWGKIKSKIVSRECVDEPVDAIVIAVYKREEW